MRDRTANPPCGRAHRRLTRDACRRPPSEPGHACHALPVRAGHRRRLSCRIAAGATSIMAPANQFYGDRNAGVKDASGIAGGSPPTSKMSRTRRSIAAGRRGEEAPAASRVSYVGPTLRSAPDYINPRMTSDRVMMNVFSVRKSLTSTAGFSACHRRQQLHRRGDVDERKRRLHDRLIARLLLDCRIADEFT